MVVHGPYPVGEPRVAREVRAALEAGWEVDVLAMRRADEPAEETVEGAQVIRLPLSRKRGAGFLGFVREYVGFTLLASVKLAGLAARRRYAVVQVHNPPDFLIVAALVPKLLGSRVVLDVHDLATDMFSMRFGGRRGFATAMRVLRMIERLATRFADAVVTVHDPYRRELVSRGVAERKLTVVMNSLDESLLPERRESRSGFDVVYHGTVTPPYGIEVLVEAVGEAAAEIPGIHLRVYGEGDAVDTVRRRAHELGIGDQVEVGGTYLPQRQVLEEISSGTVGVIPNLPIALNRYALSSKLFEYVALGIPVVCSRLPTLREHFEEEELLFFEPGDASDLARALRATAQDPAAAAARAVAARNRYEDYRWHVSAARYIGVLARLFESRDSPPTRRH